MKKLLLLVQGEGRGHMTQAIAFAQMLPGVEFRVLVGISKHRQIPAFFLRVFPEAKGFTSPNFAFDARQRSVSQFRSVLWTVPMVPTLLRSLHFVKDQIREFRPDLIVNFYEPVGGLAHRSFDIPTVAVGHQFIYEHPQTPFPPGHALDRRLFQRHTWFFFPKSHHKLALSAYPAPPHRNIVVVPPVLRSEVFALRTTCKNFALTYVVNKGYAADIGQWGLPTVCFWDNAEFPQKTKQGRVLFHPIDDRAYLRYMAHCKYLVTTAGFESMCEAAFLGKPMVLVPVEGHFEQLCNATDAAAHGIATHASGFRTIDFAKVAPPAVDRAWLTAAPTVIPPLLERFCRR